MYTIPLMGVVGLLVMVAKAMWVNKQDAGDANMKELAGYIARGASAFLNPSVAEALANQSPLPTLTLRLG